MCMGGWRGVEHYSRTFLDPLEQMVECVLSRDVKHEDDGVCSTEVAGGDGAKPLLARCVPLPKREMKRNEMKVKTVLDVPPLA